MEGDEKLTNLLLDLGRSIRSTIDRSQSDGTLKPEVESFFRWKVDNYKYGDNGPEESAAHGEQLTRQVWYSASTRVHQETKASAIYKTVLEDLKEAFGDRFNEYLLDSFVSRITSKCLQGKPLDDTEILRLADQLAKGLRNEPLIFGADVSLQGIVLKLDRVEFAHGYVLRRTTKEDLEKEIPASLWGMSRTSLYPMPSAFLKVEFLGTMNQEIQQRVEQAIAILRLFKVGSVSYLSYRMYSDSPFHVGGTLSPGSLGYSSDNMTITDEDAMKLRRFWESYSHVIPKSLYWPPGPGGEDHVTIAYRHYCDALLQDGLIERRIANAIMGLESLFLAGGETQELAYRVKTRIAKVLGSLDFDPLKIEHILGGAYLVRNKFAHGGRLSYNENKKLTTKYGDTKILLKTVLDYLRICIVISTTIQRVKESVIDLIDASLVDKKSDEELKGILSSARNILLGPLTG